MERQIPKWAQPIFSDHICSICACPHVHFEKLDTWEEKVDLENGPIIYCTNFAMKCWCKDCFEDCGGKNAQRFS